MRAAVEAAGDSARAAERALRGADNGTLDVAAVVETLGAVDLVDKPSSPNYRKDAYARLLLWLELLAKLAQVRGAAAQLLVEGLA